MGTIDHGREANKAAEQLVGPDHDLTRLDAAWNDPHKNVVIVRAWGGVGKIWLLRRPNNCRDLSRSIWDCGPLLVLTPTLSLTLISRGT